MWSKIKSSEKGITLYALILTLIIMMILASVTARSIRKSKALQSVNDIVDNARNTIKEENKIIENVNSGTWRDVLNQKGIENEVGKR